ncbi:MAG TPA: MFS transporter [Candidatus Saccharimonadia bacterium]|nr:MFS transporter [Candidatus Saccharimonadia bacterium]
MGLQRGLYLIRAEAILTSAFIGMPALALFLGSIGLSQGEIGVSQAIFTIALCLVNVPSGWLADRFSRKVCIALGDLLLAGVSFLLPLARSFQAVVILEILMGAGYAILGGADSAILRSYCVRLGRDFGQETARITTWQGPVQVLYMLIGALLVGINPAFAIAAGGVPHLAGAVAALGITEVGARRHGHEGKRGHIKHAIHDMRYITVYALHGHKELAWAILMTAIGQQFSRPISWMAPPILIAAGVPAPLIGAAMVLQVLAGSIGVRATRYTLGRWSELRLFILPLTIGLSAMIVLGIVEFNLITIWCFVILSMVCMWFDTITPPLVLRHVSEDMSSTVVSVATTFSQLLYVIAVTIINLVGNISLHWAILANVLLFGSLTLAVLMKARAFARR